jgi:hypothetical protein
VLAQRGQFHQSILATFDSRQLDLHPHILFKICEIGGICGSISEFRLKRRSGCLRALVAASLSFAGPRAACSAFVGRWRSSGRRKRLPSKFFVRRGAEGPGCSPGPYQNLDADVFMGGNGLRAVPIYADSTRKGENRTALRPSLPN